MKFALHNDSQGLLFLLEVLVAYRILCTFVPIISVWSPTIVNIPVLLLLYFIFVNSLGIDGILNVIFKYAPLVLLFALDYILRSPDSGFVGVLLSVLRLLVWPLAIEIISKSKKEIIAKRLFLVFFVGVSASMITTYLGNIEIPGVSRAMAHLHSDGEAEWSRFYQRMNIGGFDFIYLLPFLPPFAILLFKKISKWWVKCLSVAFLCVVSLTVYEAQYTTALVLSLLSVTLFFLPQKISMKGMIGYYVLFVIIFLISSSYLVQLFNQASEQTEFSTYTERFANISELMNGEDLSGNDADNRILLYKKSLTSFAQNPIVGSVSSVGGHSFVFDMLGGYGIIGLFVLYFGFVVVYKKCVKAYLKCPIYQVCVYEFVLMLALAILNPIFSVEVFIFLIPIFNVIVGQRIQ